MKNTLKILGDMEISLLKARLGETEKSMERIVAHIGLITSKLGPLVIAEALDGVDFGKEVSKENEDSSRVQTIT